MSLHRSAICQHSSKAVPTFVEVHADSLCRLQTLSAEKQPERLASLKRQHYCAVTVYQETRSVGGQWWQFSYQDRDSRKIQQDEARTSQAKLHLHNLQTENQKEGSLIWLGKQSQRLTGTGTSLSLQPSVPPSLRPSLLLSGSPLSTPPHPPRLLPHSPSPLRGPL